MKFLLSEEQINRIILEDNQKVDDNVNKILKILAFIRLVVLRKIRCSTNRGRSSN